MPCSLSKSVELSEEYIISIFMDEEKSGKKHFFQNIGWLSTYYTVLYPRRCNFLEE